MRKLVLVVSVAISIALVAGTSRAEGRPADALTISLLTMGPGDHPFFKFGHNAIWVHDASRNRSLVYNYGTFAFDSPTLIIDFLRGRFSYWLSVQSLHGTLANYARENRSVHAQELSLTPDQKQELVKFLEWNARPENKYYKYDYYLDNCSTRIRDLIDRVTRGRLRAASERAASLTLREHTRRLTTEDLPVYLGLDVAMGDAIDQPMQIWDEMFLPSKLEETVKLATVPAPDGDRPLVRSESVLVRADRPPARSSPPRWTLAMLVVGVALGGALTALGTYGARSRAWARWTFAVAGGLLGLVSGILGTLFVLLWAFTDHRVAFANENILQLPPWAALLPLVLFGAARRRSRSAERAYRLALVLLSTSLVGLSLKMLPSFDQKNLSFIAMFVPIWLGVFCGARALLMAKTPQDVGSASKAGANGVRQAASAVERPPG